jgi:NADPH:quinone reductase-like Zn-dependent oxidoreductase
MKAIRVHTFGGPDVLQMEDVTLGAPGAGQVRVRIAAAGVNPVEAYIRTGTHARKPALPYTPGSDAAGTIDAAGDGVTSLATGDRVFVAAFNGFSTGTYAEQAIVDAALVHPLPDSLTFAQGAAVGVPCMTAWRALFQKARVEAGETVLIHGASGGVGTAAVQLASAAGASVIATASTDAGRTLSSANGAAHVVDHTAEGYRDEIVRLSGGRGPDVIIEMLANVNLAHDLAMLAARGRIVVVGNRGSLDFNPRAIMAKDATILGMTLPNLTPADTHPILAGVTAALRTGVLRPVVGREMALADAAKAHDAIMLPGAQGKLVLLT